MIRKTLRKLIQWIVRDDGDREVVETLSTNRMRKRASMGLQTDSDYLRSPCMSFNLYAAEGGTVIETTMYNDKTDRNENRLYLISEGEDFGNMLSQIVSMERLKSWH